MKYLIPAIIALQFSICCRAQNNTSVGMSVSAINDDAYKNANRNFIMVDSAIDPSKRVAPWFVERFKIAAGFFVPISNTNISVGNSNGNIGTEIDFENDLGFKKNDGTFIADVQWRATRRSRFDLSYYGVNRSSTYTLKKDIVFADHTYNVNASVRSFFNTNIYRFSYGYALLAKPKFELGALIGVHVVRGEVGLGLNSGNVGVTVSDDFGFTAPLPDLGIWGGYAFSPRFAVNGEADYLGLTVGDIRGRILAYNVVFMYKVINNLDLSLGYTGLNFRVDTYKTKLNGHFKWGYNGPSLTAAFTFGNKKWVH